jgi:serine/threonine-protein kinase
MGEVYRARDHRLQRDVAIKVLPTRLSGDADRTARFEREARTLASINHPNIAIVHGFEDLAGSPALVMELVDGPTMLAGRPAFAGETMTDVLAAVIQRDPDWTRLPRDLPRSVVALLGRCLQKNPRERLRDIGDARLDLRAARAPGSDPAIPVPQLQAPAPRHPHHLWLAAAGFALGATLTGAILYVAGLRDGAASPPARTARMTITLPSETTVAFGRGSSVALSPDGRTLVYAGRARDGAISLYTRALDRFESTVLPGTEDASDPFFSPDGRWVGFFAQGKLKKVSLGGGAPVTIADVLAPRSEAWTPDDTILVTPANNKGISRVSPGGGPLTPLTALKAGEMSHRWPHVLSDGSAVVFTIWNDTGWEPASNESGRFEVYLRSFPDGERAVQVSTDGGIEPTWSRSGELFYRGLNGMVMAVTVALTPELRVDKPRALFDGRGYENIFQASPDGRRLLMMPRLDNELSVTQVNVVLDFLSELRQRVK